MTESVQVVTSPNITEDKTINFNFINEILSKVFKHDGFRTELQRDAVVEACKFRRDIFVSLPTGSGKSLIYQLPAVYKNNGLIIVVSPLVALISNQLLNAKKLGIPCATINSHMTKAWNMNVKNELKDKDTKLRLLYLTPETLCSDNFQPYLHVMVKNKTLKMFAIDEAHCVSSWGHEFRPDYLKLRHLRERYALIPIIALTATATNKIFKDIIDVLNLNEPKRIVASSFRRNLFYDVINVDEFKGRVLDDLTNLIQECLGLKKRKQVCDKKQNKQKLNGQINQKFGKNSNLLSNFVSTASSFTTADKLLKTSSDESSAVGSRDSKELNNNNINNNKQKAQVKQPNGTFKEPKESNILAPESARITSFFKPKPVELIDLIEDDGDDDDIKVIYQTSKTEELSDKTKKVDTQKTIGFQLASSHSEHTSSRSKTLEVGEIKKEKERGPGVGIVYCRTKISCEDVASHLEMKGVSARPYHSGLSAKQRAEIEKLWMDENVLVICATISFGMGIDKANVRTVIHFNMSQSLANYYQESGRAGRDGKAARCRLYYSQSDQKAIGFLLRKDMEGGEPNEDGGFDGGESQVSERKRRICKAAMERFERMVDYCKSGNKCRHLILAKEFALADDAGLLINGCGKSCDYCFRLRATSAATKGTTTTTTSSSSSSCIPSNRRSVGSMGNLSARRRLGR